ncbi:MAG: glycosyltransferase [Kiritimatiellae bacterium]|nr:glycosyltransferase [Kiritimatiellia bacterium]
MLQIVDSLDMGGTERMVVSLATALAQEGIGSHVCVTRHIGPLGDNLPPHVPLVSLNRRWRFDLAGIVRLRGYIRENRITHIHAHSTSLVMGWLGAVGQKGCALVWHIHSGVVPAAFSWSTIAFRLLGHRIDQVCCASQNIAEGLRKSFRSRADSVIVVPNIVPAEDGKTTLVKPLPGSEGRRVVCVANLRPEKDHRTLLGAFAKFSSFYPDWHLLLVGRESEKGLLRQLQQLAVDLTVQERVHFLGLRRDVSAILRGCDIGVLSSVSEAFPVVLLEYGAAGLPVVATAVGDVPAILRNGEVGVLVPSGNVSDLAGGLCRLAGDVDLRRRLGASFQRHIMENFSATKVLGVLISIYESISKSR